MTTTSVPRSGFRPDRAAHWALRVVVGGVFIAAGVLKLAGAPPMVAIFTQIGAGQWLRYVTGIVELTGGVLVLWPRHTGTGALLLAATMVCGLAIHATILGGTWEPAFVLLLLSALLVWLNRGQLPLGK